MSDQDKPGTDLPSTQEWIEGGAKNPDDYDAPETGGSGDQDRIRQRAHELWEGEGRPEGRDAAHWLQAEREVRGESASGKTTTAAPEEGQVAAAVADEVEAPARATDRRRKPG